MSAGLAVAAVATATGLTLASRIAKGEPVAPRIIIGGGVAAVMLAGASAAIPQIVRALSFLIILGALLGPGYSLAQPLTRLVTQ